MLHLIFKMQERFIKQTTPYTVSFEKSKMEASGRLWGSKFRVQRFLTILYGVNLMIFRLDISTTVNHFAEEKCFKIGPKDAKAKIKADSQ